MHEFVHYKITKYAFKVCSNNEKYSQNMHSKPKYLNDDIYYVPYYTHKIIQVLQNFKNKLSNRRRKYSVHTFSSDIFSVIRIHIFLPILKIKLILFQFCEIYSLHSNLSKYVLTCVKKSQICKIFNKKIFLITLVLQNKCLHKLAIF